MSHFGPDITFQFDITDGADGRRGAASVPFPPLFSLSPDACQLTRIYVRGYDRHD